MAKTIGIIGIAGRMGSLLVEVLNQHGQYIVNSGFDRRQVQNIRIFPSLTDVFEFNDYVIDFSSSSITEEVLQAALSVPKPLIICTTGWKYEMIEHDLNLLSQQVPVIIASNTSLGAYLQRHLVRQLAKVLDVEYDIDLVEKHHRNKVDIPSGTAMQLLSDIVEVKKKEYNANYQYYSLQHGPRPENFINVNVERSGQLPGEHEVTFISDDEIIAVKHISFNRRLFAKGTLKILNWLKKNKPKPGIYTTNDIFKLESS